LADLRPTAMARGEKVIHAWVELGMLVSPSNASWAAKALAPRCRGGVKMFPPVKEGRDKL
jgi:hypothetical protein